MSVFPLLGLAGLELVERLYYGSCLLDVMDSAMLAQSWLSVENIVCLTESWSAEIIFV